MIFFYSDRYIHADIFVRSLTLFLKERVNKCSFDFFDREKNPDLVLVDGEGLHPQQLKKIVRCYEGASIILISNRKFKSLDMAAVISSDESMHNIADICCFLLGKQKKRRDTGLSLTEERLLKKLLQGASNKEIARDYDLALSTVKYHLRNLYEKMGVKNRTQAALKARETIL